MHLVLFVGSSCQDLSLKVITHHGLVHLFRTHIIELFQVVHVLFFGRFKCVTDFEFAFLIAAKIVTSDGMKFIFVVTAHLIAALFVNFGGFDLKGGLGYGGG